MLIKVDISSFSLDAQRNLPQIVLKESKGERLILIDIGSVEASAIAISTMGVVSERPLTIDLAQIILEQLDADLSRVTISDLRKDVFYATLHIASLNGMRIVDCRPSDALGLAVRCDTPIFVEEHVFDKYYGDDKLNIKNNLRKHLSQMDTLDFGKYYLK